MNCDANNDYDIYIYAAPVTVCHKKNSAECQIYSDTSLQSYFQITN